MGAGVCLQLTGRPPTCTASSSPGVPRREAASLRCSRTRWAPPRHAHLTPPRAPDCLWPAAAHPPGRSLKSGAGRGFGRRGEGPERPPGHCSPWLRSRLGFHQGGGLVGGRWGQRRSPRPHPACCEHISPQPPDRRGSPLACGGTGLTSAQGGAEVPGQPPRPGLGRGHLGLSTPPPLGRSLGTQGLAPLRPQSPP